MLSIAVVDTSAGDLRASTTPEATIARCYAEAVRRLDEIAEDGHALTAGTHASIREAVRCVALYEAHAPVTDGRPAWALRAVKHARHATLLAAADSAVL